MNKNKAFYNFDQESAKSIGKWQFNNFMLLKIFDVIEEVMTNLLY